MLQTLVCASDPYGEEGEGVGEEGEDRMALPKPSSDLRALSQDAAGVVAKGWSPSLPIPLTYHTERPRRSLVRVPPHYGNGAWLQ